MHEIVEGGKVLEKNFIGIAMEWLANYLAVFDGAYIIVSHDYDFLEKVSSCICDIEFGTIKKYTGKYSDFLKQKEHLREDYIRQYEAPSVILCLVFNKSST